MKLCENNYVDGETIRPNDKFRNGPFELRFRDIKAYGLSFGQAAAPSRNLKSKTGGAGKRSFSTAAQPQPLWEPTARNPFVVISAQSAGFEGGNFAITAIDDGPVVVEKNSDGHYRGLHIVALHPETGKVLLAKCFDTYKSGDEFDAFIQEPLPKDSVIVAACADDCISHLSFPGKKWFSDMGSREIWNLEYRCGFSFIGVVGRQEATEKRAIGKDNKVQVTMLFNFKSNSNNQELTAETAKG